MITSVDCFQDPDRPEFFNRVAFCPICGSKLLGRRLKLHLQKVHGEVDVETWTQSVRYEFDGQSYEDHTFSPSLVQCPSCAVMVRPDRLKAHITKVHPSDEELSRAMDAYVLWRKSFTLPTSTPCNSPCPVPSNSNFSSESDGFTDERGKLSCELKQRRLSLEEFYKVSAEYRTWMATRVLMEQQPSGKSRCRFLPGRRLR